MPAAHDATPVPYTIAPDAPQFDILSATVFERRVAHACYEVERLVFGMEPNVPWEGAPGHTRRSFLANVRAYLAHELAPPCPFEGLEWERHRLFVRVVEAHEAIRAAEAAHIVPPAGERCPGSDGWLAPSAAHVHFEPSGAS